MGAIYLGKKLGAGGFEKQVVLKQLLPEFTSQSEFIDLFLREARLSATLDHANIIHTIDLVTAGNEYFIVMEYLAGGDLRTLLKKAKRRRSRFSAAAGLYIAREVSSALAYAHAKIGPDGQPLRLIHRDVSPSNILISHNGEVKLTDFGIAKAATHNSIFYRVKGKVGYMSPEQAKSDPLDHRSDLYSLAVCMYEIITGERLFVHAGLTSTPEEIYGQSIPLVSRKVPGLPADLDKVMLKALSIDPDARYQTAGELQEALLRCAHRNGLMMSAPELAQHLRDVCGPTDQWRDVEGRESTGFGGGGTEVYDEVVDGTEQIDLSKEEPDSDVQVIDSDVDFVRGREGTSITALPRLQGLALTSMIKVVEDESEGAEPLVDLDNFGPPPEPSRGPPLASLFEREDPSESIPPPVRQPVPAAERGRSEARSEERARIDVRPMPRAAERGAEIDVPTQAVPPIEMRRSRALPWLILLIILLAGGVVALVIGLSGPEVTPARGGVAPSAAPAEAPAATTDPKAPGPTPSVTEGAIRK